MLKFTPKLLVAALFAVFISAPSPAPAADALNHVTGDKKISVGFSTTRPWAFLDADGTLKGIEPDLIRAIFPSVAIETVGTEFAGLIPGLQAGRFDVSNGGLYITPQRCKLVAFSNPFLRVGDGLIVLEGNPHNIHSYKDLADHPELKIGTARGSINAQNMAAAGIPATRLLLLPDSASLIAALKSRRLDAASFSRGAAAGLMLDPGIRPGLELVSPFIGTVLPDGTEKRGYAAFAMRPEDKELQAAFDAGLARLEADGSLLTVLKRYGFDSNDLPGDAKAETLCKG